MESSFGIVTPTVTTQLRRSRFREEFDMPYLTSDAVVAVSPTAEPQNPVSNLSEPTDDSETMDFIPMLSRKSARSSWSSGSWKSSTSDAVKKWARYPLKKMRDGAAKLSQLKRNPQM